MEDKTLDIKLTVNDINTVLTGLAELPAKQSYDLINKIKGQGETQLASQNESAGATKNELLQE